MLDGKSRVDGVALGVTGNITPEWAVFANYTYLDSEVRQSVSDFCIATPGATGCGNSAAIPDPQAGDRLIQTPKHSGSLFTTYVLPFGLQIGYGITYQGKFATNQRNLAQRTQFMVDDYLIHRAFVSYDFKNGFVAQLNVSNLTNEDYYTGVRNNVGAATISGTGVVGGGAVSGGWATPGGDRRPCRLGPSASRSLSRTAWADRARPRAAIRPDRAPCPRPVVRPHGAGHPGRCCG